MDTGTWVLIGIAVYFLPYMVASFRDRPDSSSIFVLDFFLGWTVLGWIGALIWAFLPVKKQRG